jgi:hypothetical protein
MLSQLIRRSARPPARPSVRAPGVTRNQALRAAAEAYCTALAATGGSADAAAAAAEAAVSAVLRCGGATGRELVSALRPPPLLARGGAGRGRGRGRGHGHEAKAESKGHDEFDGGNSSEAVHVLVERCNGYGRCAETAVLAAAEEVEEEGGGVRRALLEMPGVCRTDGRVDRVIASPPACLHACMPAFLHVFLPPPAPRLPDGRRPTVCLLGCSPFF